MVQIKISQQQLPLLLLQIIMKLWSDILSPQRMNPWWPDSSSSTTCTGTSFHLSCEIPQHLLACFTQSFIQTFVVPRRYVPLTFPVAPVNSWCLWFLVKYLSNYRTDSHEIMYRYSWSLEDEPPWFWWFPDFSPYITVKLIFVVFSHKSQLSDGFSWNLGSPEDD